MGYLFDIRILVPPTLRVRIGVMGGWERGRDGLTVPAVVLAGSAVIVGAGALDEGRGGGGIDGGGEDGGEDGGEGEENGGELHDCFWGFEVWGSSVSF